MNQKITHDSIRFSPIALALVLLVVLGLMALRAHAEEYDFGSSSLREQMQQNVEERQALFERQREEFREASLEYRERLEEARVATGTTPEALGEIREQKREEVRTMYDEFKDARITLFNTQREEMRNQFMERKDELKESIEVRNQERQEKREARLSAQMQARLSEYVERIAERMGAAISRLEQIADRIGLRIEKMEEKGADMTVAKENLADAYALIEDAKEYAALIGEVSIDVLSSEDPQNQKSEIREAVTLTHEAIKEVYRALSETVQNIRASFGNLEDGEEEDDTATSSEETETQN